MQNFRVVVHGSFRKHFEEIKQTIRIFHSAGITVLAPRDEEIIEVKNGFALFHDEQIKDPRLVEILYLQHLKKLGSSGFSFFVNPEGYIGKSASYELGIAQATNVPCYFTNEPKDHPVYLHQNSIWSADLLAEYINTYQELPPPKHHKNDQEIAKRWENLILPGSIVATGAIIEYQHENPKKDAEILLVKTYKWGNRFSMVGGKVLRRETLVQALKREVKEETGLEGTVGKHLVTFDQIKNSGYYETHTQHIFIDNIFHVGTKNVALNEEAEEYIWLPAKQALRELDIEPNARHTVQLYAKQKKNC